MQFFFQRLRGGIFYSEIFLEIEDHKVNGSTPSLVLLFRPWIRCFQFFFEKNSFQVLLIFF